MAGTGPLDTFRQRNPRRLQSFPTVATLCSAFLALATPGPPEPGRLPGITENCLVSTSQQASEGTGEPHAMSKG